MILYGIYSIYWGTTNPVMKRNYFVSWNDESKTSYHKDQISVINKQQLELIRNIASTNYTTALDSITERLKQIEHILHSIPMPLLYCRKSLPLVDHEPKLYDPWSLTSRTRYGQDIFKLNSFHFYQRQLENKPNSVRSRVPDIDVPLESISAPHIWILNA